MITLSEGRAQHGITLVFLYHYRQSTIFADKNTKRPRCWTKIWIKAYQELQRIRLKPIKNSLCDNHNNCEKMLQLFQCESKNKNIVQVLYLDNSYFGHCKNYIQDWHVARWVLLLIDKKSFVWLITFNKI